MSTTQGNLASPKGIVNSKDEPEHLLVLVHGILARYVCPLHFDGKVSCTCYFCSYLRCICIIPLLIFPPDTALVTGYILKQS